MLSQQQQQKPQNFIKIASTHFKKDRLREYQPMNIQHLTSK